MPDTPEQKARRLIDAKLAEAGWLVQDRAEIDLIAGRGIAVREFNMKPGFGFADCLLYLDTRALGAVEAKADGPLTGVEQQAAKYATPMHCQRRTSWRLRSRTSCKPRSSCSARSRRNCRSLLA